MTFQKSLIVFLLAACLSPASRAADALPFKLAAPIKGADGSWDYASVDEAHHRLLVARADGVMAVDIASGAITPHFAPGKRVHGVIMVPGDLGVSSNGDTSSVTIFQGRDGAVLAELPAGSKPDAVVLDDKSGLTVVMNGNDGTATLIDTAKRAVAGSLSIGGKLEFAAADGSGRVFVNVEDKNELVFLDIPGRQVIGHYPLAGCDSPTGLALDRASQVLLASCGNGVAIAVSARDGHVLATLPIGKGPDAVMFDEKGKRFLVPCGGDGVLSVIQENGNGALTVIATVPTAKGARTGAFDPATGKVFLPAADYGAPAKPGDRPAMLPGTFHIVVLEPK